MSSKVGDDGYMKPKPMPLAGIPSYFNVIYDDVEYNFTSLPGENRTYALLPPHSGNTANDMLTIHGVPLTPNLPSASQTLYITPALVKPTLTVISNQSAVLSGAYLCLELITDPPLPPEAFGESG